MFVDLEAAKRLLLKVDMGLDIGDAERHLLEAETVTVTRCKECRYCMNGQLLKWPKCSHPEHPGQRVRLDGYCDLGEKRVRGYGQKS